MARTLADAMAVVGGPVEVPFCCHVHGDRHPSASYNRIKKVWHCYTCGAGGRAEGVSESEDAEFGADVLDLLGDSSGERSERWLDQFDADGPGPYWPTRFTAAACASFRLGYDHGAGESVYPLRSSSGRVLGVVRRPATGPKYRYPAGVSTSELLFGYERASSGAPVVLVEGAMDVIAAWEAGISALGLYGSRLSGAQRLLLSRLDPSEVVLALDNDPAGRQAMHGRYTADGQPVPGIAGLLADAGFTVRCVDWEGIEAKDVAELAVPERRALLTERAPAGLAQVFTLTSD